jgi:enoyl-CoA hydratase/carnithine racemase
VPAGQQLERAVELAQTVAKRAPLGVAATLQSSWKMLEEGPKAAAEALADEARRLMDTEDAMEGMRSFVERREGRFQGR